jgi:hypothetical protein
MICVWIDTRVLVAAAVLGLLVERVLGITDARLVQVFFFFTFHTPLICILSSTRVVMNLGQKFE